MTTEDVPDPRFYRIPDFIGALIRNWIPDLVFITTK